MNKIKKIIKDVSFISKLTKTKNKKNYIFASLFLSQLSAFTDIAIISIFSALIADQYTSIELVNKIINFILENKILIIFLVTCRFLFQYLQKTIIYKLELDVNKNLKEYVLNDIFEKRNFSVSDSYFFVNVLTMHTSYFYSSFTTFLNNLFQIFAYSVYLVISDLRTVLIFGIGILFLFLPIYQLLKKSRIAMHESYTQGQEANKEVERVVDNLFLIKILNKESFEINRFSATLKLYTSNLYDNFRFGIVNSLLPSFFTLLVLSFIISFTTFVNKITLDFIAVTLRLFQSLGGLANATNQIINSHVHIEKFYEMVNAEVKLNKDNYVIDTKSNEIKLDDISFSYINSENKIFEKLNISIPKNSHTILIGPNGSGKSTLIGLITGIYFADLGNVKTFSRSFGYIGATPLIFNSSMRENILYGNSKKIEDKQVIQTLKELDTFKEKAEYDLDRKISNKNLSSGQMQKIAFVRALLNEPEILVLDEATANLDDRSKRLIFKILKDKNVTIINSTHDPTSFQDVDFIIEIKIIQERRVLDIRKNQ